jgi:phosphatidylethanolamine-binding protein (PEBP) family uncharacterized protein
MKTKTMIMTAILLLLAACGSQGAAGVDRPQPPSAGTGSTPPAATPAGGSSGFTLSSPAVAEGGDLPAAYTCDGARATLPLAWSGAPAGVQSYAVIMHHVPGPGDTHWYWVLYDLPAASAALAENASGLGTLGANSVNGRAEYAPPCSKGPGAKTYTYTVYALSAAPQLAVPADQVDRDALLAAIADRTLASASLNVVYSR